MTPAQLRAFSAVVRLGSVHAAAEELGVSDAGVSMHVAQLRKELDDPLFSRTAAGLAFTPGGLRLASRAIEILGLQQQTAIEVTEAAHGRRLLRIAASSAFAEHAAPGLIELFSSRADDLSVELSVHPTGRFRDLIESRAVDVALGPAAAEADAAITVRPFLKYQIITVASADSPLTSGTPSPALLREQNWMLGPSAGGVDGEIAGLLRSLAIPESAQRIFQSDAAALEEVQRVGGVVGSRGIRGGQRPFSRAAQARQRAGAATVRRMVGLDAVTGRASARRDRAAELHHHAALYAGDDPRHRGGCHPVPPESPRDALELTPVPPRADAKVPNSM